MLFEKAYVKSSTHRLDQKLFEVNGKILLSWIMQDQGMVSQFEPVA